MVQAFDPVRRCRVATKPVPGRSRHARRAIPDLGRYLAPFTRRDAPPASRSFVCQSRHFESAWYRRWARRIAAGDPALDRFGPEFAVVFRKVWDAMRFDGTRPRYRHRKMWEWCAIAAVLDEAALLGPGRRGCGFAVGHEPLPSLFAALGVEVLGTDLLAGTDDPGGWTGTGQRTDSLASMHWPNLIAWSDFQARARFQPADMRTLEDLSGGFDFLWSSCALEHLGSLEAGLAFIERAMHLLRPGGLAVHTTEFNVSSRTATIESGDAVIYRESDIRALADRLAAQGARLRTPDFTPGGEVADTDFDRPPYYTTGRQHVKLQLGAFVATSILLVAEAGKVGAPA
jgi:hypothetical protein